MRSKAVKQRIIRNRGRRLVRWMRVGMVPANVLMKELDASNAVLVIPPNHGQSAVREFFNHWQQLVRNTPRGPTQEPLVIGPDSFIDFPPEWEGTSDPREMITHDIKYLGK